MRIALALVLAQDLAEESVFATVLDAFRELGPAAEVERYSSNFRLAAFTTSAKTRMSASILLRNSSPGPPPGLTAIALSFSRTPASASARRNSVPSLLAIGGGVAAATNSPLQRPIFTSG